MKMLPIETAPTRKSVVELSKINGTLTIITAAAELLAGYINIYLEVRK